MNLKNDIEFEKIFKEHYSLLCNAAMKVVKERNTAEDIVQDVFMKIWNSRSKLNVNTSIKAYLYKSVVNTALSHLEKNKNLSIIDKEIAENTLTSEVNESQLSDGEILQLLKNGIEELPPKCQTIFSLSRFEGLTNNEIAEYLDLSPKTVENQIGIALAQLRKNLKPIINKLLILFYFIKKNTQFGGIQ